MHLLKSLVRLLRARLADARTRGQLARLRAIPTEAAGRIADAVDDALHGRLQAEEGAWVERIEARRAAQAADVREIELPHFGAAPPRDRTTTPVSEVCRNNSSPPFWALVLLKLVRQFQPATAVEMGTCLGISAAYIAAGQQLGGQGRLVTLEGAPSLAALAGESLRALGLDRVEVVCGDFRDTLHGVLEANRPIDFAFIDGHHDEQATVAYFEAFRPHLAEKAVLAFDDIAWSDGMRRAWATIQDHPDVKLAVDLRRIGIAVVDRDAAGRHALGVTSIRVPGAQ